MLHLPQQSNSMLARAAAHHVRWLSTLHCTARAEHAPFVPGDISNGPVSSNNWSGYQVNTNAPNYAQAEWDVPNVASSAGNQSSFSVIWPGIGGGENVSGTGDVPGQLLQDGTAQFNVCTDVAGECSFSALYFFWFEDFDKEGIMQIDDPDLNPSPGDPVAASVFWSASTSTVFTLCNFFLNVCGALNETGDAAPGATAEWIVERPTLPAGLPPLANFGAVALLDAGFDEDASGNVTHTIASGGAEPVTMFRPGTSVVLASSSVLDTTGTQFTVTFHAAS